MVEVLVHSRRRAMCKPIDRGEIGGTRSYFGFQTNTTKQNDFDLSFFVKRRAQTKHGEINESKPYRIYCLFADSTLIAIV